MRVASKDKTQARSGRPCGHWGNGSRAINIGDGFCAWHTFQTSEGLLRHLSPEVGSEGAPSPS
jgi:hypothetical protein